jgi:hypothetical protein
MVVSLFNLGRSLQQQDPVAAREWLSRCLSISAELEYKEVIAYALAPSRRWPWPKATPDVAARLEATTDSLLEEMGIPLQASEQELFEQTKEATRERLGDDAYREGRVQAGATSVADVIAEAIAESALRAAPSGRTAADV